MQRASRGGWTPELAGRALAALRIAGTYAIGKTVGQRLAKPDEMPVDGELVVSGPFGRGRAFVSGSATTEGGLGRVRAAWTRGRAQDADDGALRPHREAGGD